VCVCDAVCVCVCVHARGGRGGCNQCAACAHTNTTACVEPIHQSAERTNELSVQQRTVIRVNMFNTFNTWVMDEIRQTRYFYVQAACAQVDDKSKGCNALE
jgi:hypothetical protein